MVWLPGEAGGVAGGAGGVAPHAGLVHLVRVVIVGVRHVRAVILGGQHRLRQHHGRHHYDKRVKKYPNSCGNINLL